MISGEKRGHVILRFEFPDSSFVPTLPFARTRFNTLYDIEPMLENYLKVQKSIQSLNI
jgi:hypothetical protein